MGWGLVAVSSLGQRVPACVDSAGIGVGLLTRRSSLVSHSASKEERESARCAGASEPRADDRPGVGQRRAQRFGEGSAYASASVAFALTTLVMLTYPPTHRKIRVRPVFERKNRV